MKRNRSLSVIYEDEYKYDGDEIYFLLIPSSIIRYITGIVYTISHTYHKMMDCLKGIEKDND